MSASPIQLQNFIGGRFVAPRCNQYLESRDPSRGTVHSLVPDSNKLDVEDAVDAAQKAFSEWSMRDAAYRSRLLNKVADLLESRSEAFAEAESRDQGKPLWVARAVDIPRAVLNFRHFANAVLCEKDTCISEYERGILHYTSRSPCGVVAIIVPWNLPLYLLSFKLAPALVHGNTVVAKPSEYTSLTAWMLCSILKEAGISDGVVNMVFGRGDRAGDALIRHPQVRLISFTGSDKAGLHIGSVAGASAKKVSLEMGGKNACIVFADADLEECIPTLVRSSFLNQGQICLSTSRIYAEKSIFDIFVKKFVEEVRKIRVGDPFQPGTWMGPVCSREHFDRIRMYLKIAKEEGATFLTGDEEEQQQIQLPEEHKKVGTVWCNCWLLRNLHMPFGGQKMSGIGHEGTEDSREFYTVKKTICVKYTSDASKK